MRRREWVIEMEGVGIGNEIRDEVWGMGYEIWAIGYEVWGNVRLGIRV